MPKGEGEKAEEDIQEQVKAFQEDSKQETSLQLAGENNLVDVINHFSLVKARKGEREKKKATNSQTASSESLPGSSPVGNWNAFKVIDTISIHVSRNINQIWANTERSVRALCS